MSFLKISDPAKRDSIVNEYLRLKKSIQQQSLEDKLGDISQQYDLAKLYKPITDSQAELIAGLQALPSSITDGLTSQLKAIAAAPSIPAIEADPVESIRTLELGYMASKYLQQYLSNKKAVDKTFGIYNRDGQFYIGNSPITIQGDDVTIGDKTYQGTPGLWELITMLYPNKTLYTATDLENYAEIMDRTNAISSKTNPNKPKASRSDKYRDIIKPIWERRPYKGKLTQLSPTPSRTTSGTGFSSPIILPSDPNALIKMLDLRFAGKKAGNTGVRNEVVAISDELLRQGVLNSNSYKALMLQLV